MDQNNVTAGQTEAARHPEAAAAGRVPVGVVLGGGGEAGVAWQTGVLAALAEQAGLTAGNVDVVVGTSAGALSGASFSAGLDLGKLVEDERAGQVVTAPLPAGEGMSAIPQEIIAALGSTEGTVQERGRRIGALALASPAPITSEQFVAYAATMLPGEGWPRLDFRPTSVNARTGETVLWRRQDQVPLAAAVASSVAVPGFLPPVEIGGEHYIDAPRASFSAAIVAEKGLQAIVYIGMPTPNLSNTIEEDALTALAAAGLRVVRITGGPGSDDLITQALDPAIRPRAVELGLRDGAAAVAAVASLLRL